MYGIVRTEALVYSNHAREAAASSYLAIIFGLNAVYGIVRTEALVYSNHPRETSASSYLAIIFGWLALVPTLNSGANAAPASVHALV